MTSALKSKSQRAAPRKGGFQFKHGHGPESPTYRSWMSMKGRIRDAGRRKVHAAYLGVVICERWRHSFENFLADMGERPAGTTLDRLDNAKGYEPSNCRWATPKQQGENRACVREITFNGKTQNFEDWARELGLNPSTLRSRLDRGWPLERVLTHTPRRGTPGETGRHKLTEAQVREIRRDFKWITPHRSNALELSKRYPGIGKGTIYHAAVGNTWSHLK